MTANKHLKKLIREQQMKMGGSYTAARAALGIGRPPPPWSFARCPSCRGFLSRRSRDEGPTPAGPGDLEDCILLLERQLREAMAGPARRGEVDATEAALTSGLGMVVIAAELIENQLQVREYADSSRAHSAPARRAWPLVADSCPTCTRLRDVRLLFKREEDAIADDLEQVHDMLTTGLRRYAKKGDTKLAANMMGQAIDQLRFAKRSVRQWEWPSIVPLFYASQLEMFGVRFGCFASEQERAAYVAEAPSIRQAVAKDDAGLLAAIAAGVPVTAMKYLGRGGWQTIISTCIHCRPEHANLHGGSGTMCPNCFYYAQQRTEEQAE